MPLAAAEEPPRLLREDHNLVSFEPRDRPHDLRDGVAHHRPLVRGRRRRVGLLHAPRHVDHEDHRLPAHDDAGKPVVVVGLQLVDLVGELGLVALKIDERRVGVIDLLEQILDLAAGGVEFVLGLLRGGAGGGEFLGGLGRSRLRGRGRLGLVLLRGHKPRTSRSSSCF